MKNLIISWETDETFLLPHLLNEYDEFRVSKSNHIEDAVNYVNGYRLDDLRIFLHFNVTFSDVFTSPLNRTLQKVLEAGGYVANLSINDISKNRVQVLNRRFGLPDVSPSTRGDQLIIVKSNYNYCGRPERFSKLSDQYLIKKSSLPDDFSYRVCPYSEVSDSELKNRDIIIERYINNEKDIIFRAYIMLGKIVISRVTNFEVIKKMQKYHDRKNFTDKCINRGNDKLLKKLLLQVKTFSENCSLDFGTLDVVMDDDSQFYIIDLNSTPSWGKEAQGELIDYLTLGK